MDELPKSGAPDFLTELDPIQRQQVHRQLQDHKHSRYAFDLEWPPSFKLKNFAVFPNVLRPDRMIAMRLAYFLASHPNLYHAKSFVDVGCGSGIQGIVMLKNGATHGIFTDISNDAIQNTIENINQYNLQDKSQVLLTDLLEGIREKVHIIVFNHPFFAAKPSSEEPVSLAMLDEGELLQRFLTTADNYLKPGGKIIMPYFHEAGPTNNPQVQAPKHGYHIEAAVEGEGIGMQSGKSSISILQKNKQP